MFIIYSYLVYNLYIWMLEHVFFYACILLKKKQERLNTVIKNY